MEARTADVHSHIILPEYVDFMKHHGAEMDENFPLPNWSEESALHLMETAEIGYSVLTMPAPQPFFGDAEESRKIIRFVNEKSAELKSKYPEKFRFCAALPLPDVDLAIEEALYALDILKADGIKLATNSRGQYVGDQRLDPLMEILNEREAVIILHPHKPIPVSEKIVKITPLAIYEYPAETTRAVMNMISRNILVKFPKLKIVVPHCGSFLPMAIPRAKSIQPVMQKMGYMESVDWDANLSRLYYDLAGNPTPEILKMMLTITMPDHLLYGSDFPYLPAEIISQKLNQLKQILSDDETLKPFANAILFENAQNLFG